MELVNPKLTIVVNTCDAYADVLSLFISAIKEYWPNRAFPIVINTEGKPYITCDNTITSHLYPKSNKNNYWGARLLSTLNSVGSEYVLMLYDDFILEELINIDEIEAAVCQMNRNRTISVIYLVDLMLSTGSNSGFENKYKVIPDFINYRLNSSPAIWRKDDLVSFTREIDNPWAWEVFGSYRTFGINKLFLSVKSPMENIYKYNYEKGGAIYRGKWVKEVAEEKIIKYRLPINLEDRGLLNIDSIEKRSIAWKLKFMWTGFRAVGFKFLYFVYFYLKTKLKL